MRDAGIPPPDIYDPAMVSYACDEMAMLAGVGESIEEHQEGAFVTYEDPSQRAERKKLMKLLVRSVCADASIVYLQTV